MMMRMKSKKLSTRSENRGAPDSFNFATFFLNDFNNKKAEGESYLEWRRKKRINLKS